MSDTDTTDEHIKPLVALKELQYLNLRSTNVRNVQAFFGSEGSNSELHSDMFCPPSHPNLVINLQQTVRALRAPRREIRDETRSVVTPQELYEILNNEYTEHSSLKFFFTPSLKHLQHLATQANLWYLDLSNSDITDISPLSGLLVLRSLDLTDTAVTDLSPVYDKKIRIDTIIGVLPDPKKTSQEVSRQLEQYRKNINLSPFQQLSSELGQNG